jgi:hypothetical protein
MIGERTWRLYTEPVDEVDGDPGQMDHRGTCWRSPAFCRTPLSSAVRRSRGPYREEQEDTDSAHDQTALS